LFKFDAIDLPEMNLPLLKQGYGPVSDLMFDEPQP